MRLRRATDPADAVKGRAAPSRSLSRRVSPVRRLIRFVLLLAVLFLVLSVAAVALYRVLPSPAPTLILLPAAEGYGMTKFWSPLDESSANLVRAATAGEDSCFCQHRG